jgi:hypothetical protein
MKPNDKKSPVQDAGKDGAEGVQLSCKVLVGGLKVGNFKKGRGAVFQLPQAEAEALAKLGRVQILGV